MDLGGFLTELRTTDTYKYLGKIEKIVGMTIEASGPLCSIGDVCRIYTKDMKSHIPAEWWDSTSIRYCLCRIPTLRA